MKDRIKKVREQNGMSSTKFAEALKTSVATISYYESGKRTPSDAVLNLISEKFHVSYAWLKNGEGPMEDPLPDDAALDRLTETYRALPERLMAMVDVLASMDPEWYKTLDAAFEELEKRKKQQGGVG